jgi:predicted DsbA family dithiol-disulfide isomerase
MVYTPAPPDPLQAKKPKTPTRFELLLAADGLVLPERTIPRSISRLALEGSEFALKAGKQEKYLDELYLAYWEGSKDIANIAVLIEIAEKTGLEIAQFALALDKRTFRDTVIEYDEPAHTAGIWNVPTFMFPEAWVAEQPYTVLRDMTERFVQNSENTPSD